MAFSRVARFGSVLTLLALTACGTSGTSSAGAADGAAGESDASPSSPAPGDAAAEGAAPGDTDSAAPRGAADGGEMSDAAPNPCAGVACSAPPGAYCVDTTTLRTFAPSGTCASGLCSYAHSDTTCANGCASGACEGADPCAGVLCDAPPAPTCTNASTLETYSASGTCAGGTCSYSATTTACASGCASGACLGDPCAGVACNAPPAAVCLDTMTLESFSPDGTCSQGVCSYAPTNTACANGCVAGACAADPCAGVTCASPPAPSCVSSTTLQTYGAVGTCAGGNCSYPATDTTCTSGCANGACTSDPCAGVTCTTPPAPYCATSTTLRTFSSAGTCTGGACSYASSDTACTAPANATPTCTGAACGFACNAGYVPSGTACVPACANQCPAWGATCSGSTLQTCYVGPAGCLTLMTETCSLGCSNAACNSCSGVANPLVGSALTDQTGYYKDVVLAGNTAITNFQGRSGQYVTPNWGLAAVNVATPSAPTGGHVGTIPASDALPRIALAGTKLYALDQNGVLVFDVTTPSSPTELGSFPFADTTTQKNDLSATGTLACLAANDGLHLVDFSTPSAPKAVGTYTQANVVPARGVVCSGGYAAVAGNNRIQIVDVHVPASPVMVADVAAGSFNSPGGKGLAFDGSLVYEVTYTDSGALAAALDVYAFTPPATAGSTGSLLKSGSLGNVSSINAIAAVGSQVFFGGLDSVGIVDVSHPSAPAYAKRAFFGVSSGVAGAGSTLYAAGEDFSVFDFSKVPTVVTLPSYLDDAIVGSAVVGSIGYVARASSGLVVEDLRDPTHPVVLSTTSASATGLAMSGHYAYVSVANGSSSSLQVYDVSNPAAPVNVGSTTASGQYIENLRLAGGRAYANCDGYVCVFDIGTPAAPSLLTAYNVSSIIGTSSLELPFEVSGTDLYIPTYASSAAGLAVIDMSSLSTPTLVTTLTLAGTIGSQGSLALSGSTLYAMGSCDPPSVGEDCLYTIDVSSPAAPKALGVASHTLDYETELYQELTTGDDYWQINAAGGGHWVMLNEGWGGLVVFDVSNPAAPTVANEYFTVYPAEYTFAKDRFLTSYTFTPFNDPAPTQAAADQVIEMCQ